MRDSLIVKANQKYLVIQLTCKKSTIMKLIYLATGFAATLLAKYWGLGFYLANSNISSPPP